MSNNDRATFLPPFPPDYRASGLLLHVTSLRSVYGIGDVGPSAFACATICLRRLEIETGPATGWDNIAFSYKHIIASVRAHEFAAAVSPLFEVPTGTPNTGAESHPRWGIELLAEKGLADLPEPLRALRALAVEGDAAWETKVTGAHNDLISADAEIEYSVDYFDRYTCPGCAGKRITWTHTAFGF
jgi:hypothetical protein